jgi:hypothetical protein
MKEIKFNESPDEYWKSVEKRAKNVRLQMNKEKIKTSTTTSGKPPEPGFENSAAPAPIDPETGQHGAYWVLTEEERLKGFVRPVRDSYRHLKCGTVTRMGPAIAETYARDPKFYSHTFCVQCRDHLPVAEFQWLDGQELGS